MVKAKRTKSDMRNGKKPGSLLDHSDTDSEVEFALPPRKFTKSGKSFARRRSCSNCWRTCSTMLLVLLLVASVLSIVGLIWFSLRLKNDIDYLRKRVGYAESNSRSNSQEYKEFQEELDDKIKDAKDGEKDIAVLRGQYKSLLSQIGYLNRTVAHIQQKLAVPKSMAKVVSDVQELKKGMADSLAGNTKVTSEMNNIKTVLENHNKAIQVINSIVTNITSHFEQTTGKSIMQPPTALPTLPANIQEKDNIDQAQKNPIDEMTEHFTGEIDRVMEIIGHVNESLLGNVLHLRDDLQAAKNSLNDIQTKLNASSESNTTQESGSMEELTSIKKNIESLSSSINSGLQKHNDTIISLATSLSQMKMSSRRSHTNLRMQLADLKRSDLSQVASVNNRTQELQAAIQTNADDIKRLENEIHESKNLSSQAPEEPTTEANTTLQTSQPEQPTSTSLPTETNSTIQPVTVTSVENATMINPTNETQTTESTEQINSTATTLEANTNSTTTMPTSETPASEEAPEKQTTDTSDELNDEENAEENPTRVTRSIPGAYESDEVKDLNNLLREP